MYPTLLRFKYLVLLLVLALALPRAKAANLNSDYSPDQIYLAVQEELATGMVDKNGNVNRDVFIQLFDVYLGHQSISEIRAPYYQAKSASLQSVLLLTFEQPDDLVALCKTLNQDPQVVYAERVPLITFYETYYPNDLSMDSNYSGQWYLHKIQAPEAWAIAKGSPDIKVAVVDQAIDIEHEDLRGVIWTNPGEIPDNGIDDDDNGYVDDVHGYDVAENDPDPNPDNAQQVHGTHVAGLVSVETNNSLGIAAIGFNVSIIPVKTAYSNNRGAEQFKGVTYAANAGADIISCSWGARAFSITQKNVIEYAQQQGALVVCSSGNDGKDTLGYPAAYSGVITVGATTILDRMANFSNYHQELSVSAPGNNIISTFPGNQYESMSGTSMSTPIVSGLLGLMKSHYPQITNDELKTCLLTTTDPVQTSTARYDGKTGAGRINAYKAILCVDNLKKATGIIPVAASPLNIYPNPTQGSAYVALPSYAQGEIHLQVTDVTGRQVAAFRERASAANSPIKLDTRGWTPGIYLLDLTQGNNHHKGKLVVTGATN